MRLQFYHLKNMKKSRIPWAQKLRPEMEPSVVTDPKRGDLLLLPTPLLLAEEIRTIPPGTVRSVSELRSSMAARYKADRTCPLMTGIFYNLVAGAAEEQLEQGQQPLAPWWRVVPDKGFFSAKTPPGAARQAEHLRSEHHDLIQRGDQWKLRGADPSKE